MQPLYLQDDHCVGNTAYRSSERWSAASNCGVLPLQPAIQATRRPGDQATKFNKVWLPLGLCDIVFRLDGVLATKRVAC